MFFSVCSFLLSLAEQGDFPAVFGKVHKRFETPASIAIFALLVWLLAFTGTFNCAVALTAGSMMIMYGSVCASLILLRRVKPDVTAFRVPFGHVLGVLGIAILLVLVSELERRQGLLLLVTALIATASWYWAKRRRNNAGMGQERLVTTSLH